MATKYNYRTINNVDPDKGEVNKEPSQTIPGEAMSIKQIIAHYKKTGDLTRKQPIYFDTEIENINEFYSPGELDLTDLQRLNDHVQSLLDRVDEEMTKKEEEKEEEETTTDDETE